MVAIKPFRAVRPKDELASEVAALPYDVMSSAEAREMVKDKPHSFLHVDKSEVDLPEGTDLYSDEVYAKAKSNLEQMITDGVLVKDEKPSYYIYKLVMDGHEQNGLVVAASIDDYAENRIKKHELTRAAKEEDRIRHVDTTDYHTGPIFLTYNEDADIDEVVASWKKDHEPNADFTAEDGVQHTVWVIDDEALVERLTADFEKVPALYIADGHHRCASAAKVGMRRREAGAPQDGEHARFLAVLFPKNQLEIMDYNRVLKHKPEGFMDKLKETFEVAEAPAGEPFKPTKKHQLGMFCCGKWWQLDLKPGLVDESDPVKSLDVAVLQERVLQPLFGIEDPRTSDDIDFIGGIRGLKELEKRCAEDMEVAFALYPTSLEDLIAIADAGEIMPPKSTWFEPKMRSGLFLHSLSEA